MSTDDIDRLCQHRIDTEERDLRDIYECRRMEAINTLTGAAREATKDAARLARAAQRSNRAAKQLRELARKPRESLASYVQRLDALHDKHLEACRDCDYDHECMQCNADDDGDAHNCNCSDGPGYGYQLQKTLELARMAVAADDLGPVRSVLRNWDWKQIVEDGCTNDDALDRAAKALAEAEQAITKREAA